MIVYIVFSHLPQKNLIPVGSQFFLAFSSDRQKFQINNVSIFWKIKLENIYF